MRFPKTRLMMLAGFALAAVAGAGVSRTDSLLRHEFGKALQGSQPDLSFTQPGAHGVGDEGYWLTRAEVESPAPFAKPLAIGDRITISGADGRERRLEVVDLKAMSANATSTPLRLLLVTCRVAEDAGMQENALVRFIVEAEPAPKPALPAPAKAL